MEIQYQIDDTTYTLRVEPDGDELRVSIGDRIYRVQRGSQHDAELRFTVDGERQVAYLAADKSLRYVAVDGQVFEIKQPDVRRTRQRHHHGEDNLSASMPGQVLKLLVAEGDVVERGQTLLILEAMKMEIKVAAPHAGRVAKVLIAPGQVVDRGQGLIELGD